MKNFLAFVVCSSLALIYAQQKKSFKSKQVWPSEPPSRNQGKGSSPIASLSSMRSFSKDSVWISQMFTEKSFPPEVIKYFPSLLVEMSVISPGWAISPIVELGFPSNGNFINPIIFSFVEYASRIINLFIQLPNNVVEQLSYY